MPSQTTLFDTAGMLSDLRRVFGSGRTRRLSWRLEQLRGIERLCDDREAEITAALAEDLGRSPLDAWLGDIASTKAEATYARKHLKKWMRRRRVSLPLNQLPGRGWVQYDPLGVVLVIGPWNYPLYLSLAPLVAVVAAGNARWSNRPNLHRTPRLCWRGWCRNTWIQKRSGSSRETPRSRRLCWPQGFDHALFTGGTEVGKKIMAAAAPTLTPVTLELGGKSPVIVVSDADIDVAARRIAWVKLINSGQTCIAPDYVLADRSIADELVDKIVANVREFRSAEQDPSMRIVNQRQFDRLVSLISATNGKVVAGGGSDSAALRIEPTVIVDPSPTDAVMADEIFGPILPVLTVESAEAAVEFVNGRPKPLALYVFTSSSHRARTLIDRIPSGGAVVNHVAMHCMVPQLPFGGVGASGMGAYHGRWGFEAMSHRRAVLAKSARPDLKVMYPPYTETAIKIMRRVF